MKSAKDARNPLKNPEKPPKNPLMTFYLSVIEAVEDVVAIGREVIRRQFQLYLQISIIIVADVNFIWIQVAVTCHNFGRDDRFNFSRHNVVNVDAVLQRPITELVIWNKFKSNKEHPKIPLQFTKFIK